MPAAALACLCRFVFRLVDGWPAKTKWDGAIVALFNPKTAVFFAAFLPQFIAPGQPPMVPSILLGALFVLIAAISDSAYALGASVMAPRLAGSKRLGRVGAWLGAGTYVGLGVATALVGVGA